MGADETLCVPVIMLDHNINKYRRSTPLKTKRKEKVFVPTMTQAIKRSKMSKVNRFGKYASRPRKTAIAQDKAAFLPEICKDA